MLLQQLALVATVPPKIDGGVRAAIFSAAGVQEGSWYVCVGANYFLTSESTARRLTALAKPHSCYSEAYHDYAGPFAAAEPFDEFVKWCEANRTEIEDLTRIEDGHRLRFRLTLLNSAQCARIGAAIRFLFTPRAAAIALSIIVCVMAVWFSSFRASPERSASPCSLLLVLVGILIHEIGHTSAAERFGASSGGVGLGIYWIWPAFFADVRHSWGLPHLQRAVVSASGLYFQAIYLAILMTISCATRYGPFDHAIVLTLLLMAGTLNPIMKFDGYWLLSDLTNNLNLHRQIEQELVAVTSARLLRPRLRPMSIFAAGFAVVASAYFVGLAVAIARMLACAVADVFICLTALSPPPSPPAATAGNIEILTRILCNSACACLAAWALCSLCCLSLGRFRAVWSRKGQA